MQKKLDFQSSITLCYHVDFEQIFLLFSADSSQKLDLLGLHLDVVAYGESSYTALYHYVYSVETSNRCDSSICWRIYLDKLFVGKFWV